MTARRISRALRERADPDVAAHAGRFFKTGPGEYGEGDAFLGIRVPLLRAEAKRFQDTPLEEVRTLLASRWHEERLCALLILVRRFSRADEGDRAAIYALYLDSTRHINNWDLVDSSAHHIVGAHLQGRSRRPLYRLARSPSLWERRIAVIATLHFIRQHDFEDALAICDRLLRDEEDLIHKAVGWMLREIGNRDPAAERAFLATRYADMPRVMLRYAIEKFPAPERRRYLAGTV